MSAVNDLFAIIPIGSDPLAAWQTGWQQSNAGNDSFDYTRSGEHHHMVSGQITYTGATGTNAGGNILVANFAPLAGFIAPRSIEGTWVFSMPAKNTARFFVNASKGLYMRAGATFTLTQNETWAFQISWLV